MRGQRRKRGMRLWISLVALLAAAGLVLVFCGYGASKEEPHFVASEETLWNLRLVNRWNPLPEDYEINFTVLSNGQRVDSRIYPDLQEMFDDARASGVYPVVREGYRTHEEQIQTYENKVRAYEQEQHIRTEAEQLAQQWVALPGTSEHELGLAVDINADAARCERDMVYDWLAENAWKYGFILRYPQGREDVTGIDYEPWHYRYVGRTAAREINAQNLTLEEYLSKIAKSGK